MNSESLNKQEINLDKNKLEAAEPPIKTRRKLGSMRVQSNKCMHKVIMRGLCADCGVDIENIERFYIFYF